MSKIVTAVNAMICGLDKISEISPEYGELFFEYDHKHTWSLSEGTDGEYYLFYYPGNPPIWSVRADGRQTRPYLSYSTKELKSREARESFAELYRVLKEKEYGLDAILDDIIGDA